MLWERDKLESKRQEKRSQEEECGEIQKGEGWNHRGRWTDNILDTGKARKKNVTGDGGGREREEKLKMKTF